MLDSHGRGMLGQRVGIGYIFSKKHIEGLMYLRDSFISDRDNVLT